ncbi:MAG: LLM class flavin-dependent oxidoreductase, partial [Candidatus Hodarchaeota archaeon]
VGLGFPPDEFELFGEKADARQRAKKLDEGLDILTGLWSGKSFSYKGEHFKLKEMIFLPPPVQSPRIPIWVAGMWPNTAPFRRAALWDGIIPICADFSREITPNILQEILNYIKRYRTSTDNFDVVMIGETPSDDLVKGAEKISSLIKVGMTWWLENITGRRGSFEAMRERIKQGPPERTPLKA